MTRLSARFPGSLLLLSSILVAAPRFAAAQGGTTTASLAGKVSDATGGVLPGVTVTLVNLATNQSRTVTTNEEGLYRFAGLPPNKYSVSAELEGFAKFLQPQVTLNVGAAVDLNFTMRLSSVVETLTVTAEAPIIESAKTDLSSVISRDQIEALPTIDRNYLNYALLTPGVNEDTKGSQGIGLKVSGARAKDAALMVDGFWNSDESFVMPKIKYSQDSLAEFQVENIGGAAEFGRSIGGIVSAVTKSGTNQFSGSGYGYFRNTALNSQDFVSKAQGLPKGLFSKEQWGGSLGGPIAASRTFFFTAADRSTQNFPFNNNITAQNAAIIGLQPSDAGAIDMYLYDTFSMAKLTHVVNTNNTIQGSYAMTYDVPSNFQGTFATPSRQNLWHSIDHTVAFQWTRVAHEGNWLHDLKVGYMPRHFDNTDRNLGGPPLTAEGQLRSSLAPSVNITNVAQFGGGYVLLEMYTKPVQAVYSTTIFKTSHSFKIGFDVMGANFLYLRYQGPQSGTYSFSSVANYLEGRYTTYSQNFGPPGLGRYHKYLSAYAQDSWVASKRLTVNYGLRWDGDDISAYNGQKYGKSWGNFGPRIATSYDLTGHGTTLLKLGSGLYFDRLWENPITPTYYNNEFVGPQVSATWLFGQPGAPVYPATIPGTTLPSNAPAAVRNVYIVPSPLRMPETLQFIATVDHAFSDNFATSISALATHSWHKELPVDTNLVWSDAGNPNGVCCFARPNSSFRQILQYQYWGEANYTGLVVSAQRRFQRGLRFGTNMTLARAFDQGNDWNSILTDARFPEQDWGPNADIPTVTMAANGSYDVTRFLQVSAIFHARSGVRLDTLVGSTVDVHGNGVFNQRTPGLARNATIMPAYNSLDARVTWTVPLKHRQKLQLTLEAFNLYNRANILNENSLYGPVAGQPNPAFGTPLTYYPPRQAQLGARITF